MKKGVNNIENQWEIWYEMIQNYKKTDFREQILGPIIFGTKWSQEMSRMVSIT